MRLQFPFLIDLCLICLSESYVVTSTSNNRLISRPPTVLASSLLSDADGEDSRREFLAKASALSSLAVLGGSGIANAAVGTLPEFSDTNAILQGISIKVADQSQQNAMISFLEDGFDFQLLRKRKVGNLEETWLGFGPEQLSVPDGFTFPATGSMVRGFPEAEEMEVLRNPPSL